MSAVVQTPTTSEKKQQYKVDPPALFPLLPTPPPLPLPLPTGRLPGLGKSIKDLANLLKSNLEKPTGIPLRTTGRTPDFRSFAKYLEKVKPLLGLGASVALTTLLLNGHAFLKRRTFDGGADPDSTVDYVTLIYALAYLIESYTRVNISEYLTEGLAEAFAEAFEILYVNPLTKFFNVYYGLENADDDEIKDIASAGVVSPDTMAYITLMAGLSNIASLAEIATGASYSLENSVRPLLRQIESYYEVTIEQNKRLWTWAFNRLTAEITELITTAGQIATFAVQRVREIAKKVDQLVSTYYGSYISMYERYKQAVQAGDTATADQYALNLLTTYSSAYAVYSSLLEEYRAVSEMYRNDFAKLDAYMQELLTKFDSLLADYEAYAKGKVRQLYSLMMYAVNEYKDLLQQVLDTIAKYRSDNPQATKSNIEFVPPLSYLPPGEVVPSKSAP